MPSPASEIRFLSVRSLALRWDCARSTAYAHLARMRALGLYFGFPIGTKDTDQRVALGAIERYEECLAKGETDTSRGSTAASRSASSAPASTGSTAPSTADASESAQVVELAT